MARILILLFIIIMPAGIQAQQAGEAFGKPLCWFSMNNPWPSAGNPKGPLFILYETGKVLYWQNNIYRLAELDNQELEDLTGSLQLTDTLFSRSRFVDAINDPGAPDQLVITDQPGCAVYVNRDSLVRVLVNGNIKYAGYRKNYPQVVLNVYHIVSQFSDAGSRAWLPGMIDLFLFEDDVQEPSILKWPEGWPQVVHNSTAGRKSVVYLSLDSRYYDRLLKLYSQQEAKNKPVYINGKNYRIDYRVLVPGIK